MAIYTRKIDGLVQLNAFLRGGLLSGRDFKGGVIYGLHGKTLVFTSPAVTVTFVTPGGSSQEGLSLSEVVAQINAAESDLARMLGGTILLQKTGVAVVTSNTSTALDLLGFDKAGSTSRIFNPPGGAAPALVSVEMHTLGNDVFLLTTDE